MYLRFANNRKLSLETKDGRAFLHQSLLSLARVNKYISTGILSVFSHLDQCAPEIQIPCVEILLDLISSIPETDAPTVVRNAWRILSGSPNARAVYAAQSTSP